MSRRGGASEFAQVERSADAWATLLPRRGRRTTQSRWLGRMLSCADVSFDRCKEGSEDEAVDQAVAFQVDTHPGWILAVRIENTQFGTGGNCLLE